MLKLNRKPPKLMLRKPRYVEVQQNQESQAKKMITDQDVMQAFEYPDPARFFAVLVKAMEGGFDFMSFLASMPKEYKNQHFGNAKVLMAVSYLCCGMQIQNDWFLHTDMQVITALFNNDGQKESQFFHQWNVGAIVLQEQEIRNAFIMGFQKRTMQY